MSPASENASPRVTRLGPVALEVEPDRPRVVVRDPLGTPSAQSDAFLDQRRSQGDTLGMVHFEDCHGGAADGGSPAEERSLPAKVARPFMPAWMKQADQPSGSGIEARKGGS